MCNNELEYNEKNKVQEINHTLIHQIHRIDKIMFRKVSQYARECGLDGVVISHGWILRYLAVNKDKDVFQRDLEKQLSVRRSTVTSTLQLMEKKGYILRESVPNDARLKRIILTSNGYEVFLKLKECFDKLNQYFEDMMTYDEYESTMKSLEKIEGLLDKTNDFED